MASVPQSCILCLSWAAWCSGTPDSLRTCSFCRVLYGSKDAFQGHIQVRITVTDLADILKGVGREEHKVCELGGGDSG